MAHGFLQPAQEPGTLQRIGQGLSGFGAGIQGRGPEFLAGLQRQRETLSDERQQAAAEDLRRARALLDAGDLQGVRNLAAERVGFIQELGGDPSDTMGILNLTDAALQGDENAFRALNAEINAGLQSAADRGFVDLKAGAATSAFQEKVRALVAIGIDEDIAIRSASGFEDPEAAKAKSQQEKEAKAKLTDFELTDKLIKNAKSDKRIDSHIKVTSSMDRILAANEDPTGASDIAMIFSFMKMLDPGSVVRESEFQLASDTAGAPEFVKAAASRLISGERLTPVSRANFITEANKIFERSTKTADKALRPIEARARKNNLDPAAIRNSIFGIPEEEVIEDFSQMTDEELAAIARGQ